MTKRIYEYRCSEGHTTDLLIDEHERTTSCLICGSEAKRIISIPHFKLDAISGDFPTATQRWENNHSKVTHTSDDEF